MWSGLSHVSCSQEDLHKNNQTWQNPNSIGCANVPKQRNNDVFLRFETCLQLDLKIRVSQEWKEPITGSLWENKVKNRVKRCKQASICLYKVVLIITIIRILTTTILMWDPKMFCVCVCLCGLWGHIFV